MKNRKMRVLEKKLSESDEKQYIDEQSERVFLLPMLLVFLATKVQKKYMYDLKKNESYSPSSHTSAAETSAIHWISSKLPVSSPGIDLSLERRSSNQVGSHLRYAQESPW
jgi:hypothetical protein